MKELMGLLTTAKKLIRDRLSNCYLAYDMSWSQDSSAAKSFQSCAEALQFIRENLSSHDCEVIIPAGNSSFYIAIKGK